MSEVPCLSDQNQDRNGICQLPSNPFPIKKKIKVRCFAKCKNPEGDRGKGGKRVSINRDRGKRAERAVAELIHGKRVGTMGGEDVYHQDFSVEVKSRVSFVGEKFMQQAEKNCKGSKKRTPIAVVHIQGKPHDKDIVMIRMDEWISWMGDNL